MLHQMPFKLACIVSWELGCHLLKRIEVNWRIVIIATDCLYWFLFSHCDFWVEIGFLNTRRRSNIDIFFRGIGIVKSFCMLLFHCLNLLFELIVGLLFLQIESLQLVDLFEGFLELDTQIHVIFQHIGDLLFFQAFNFLEFIQKPMGLFIQECFALQIFLVMVNFRFKLLQYVFLSIQNFGHLFHFFLYDSICTVLLVLQILNDLWHHELLGLRFLLFLL